MKYGESVKYYSNTVCAHSVLTIGRIKQRIRADFNCCKAFAADGTANFAFVSSLCRSLCQIRDLLFFFNLFKCSEKSEHFTFALFFLQILSLLITLIYVICQESKSTSL